MAIVVCQDTTSVPDDSIEDHDWSAVIGTWIWMRSFFYDVLNFEVRDLAVLSKSAFHVLCFIDFMCYLHNWPSYSFYFCLLFHFFELVFELQLRSLVDVAHFSVELNEESKETEDVQKNEIFDFAVKFEISSLGVLKIAGHIVSSYFKEHSRICQ